MSKARDERRVVLPIPERVRPETAMIDAKDPDQVFRSIEPIRPPEGAPNVLVVLLDVDHVPWKRSAGILSAADAIQTL